MLRFRSFKRENALNRFMEELELSEVFNGLNYRHKVRKEGKIWIVSWSV